MTQQTETENFIEICPGCLACYNQGRLTFYWFQINKDTTLKQLERALDVEEIHRKAKTPFLCGGEEVSIQDNDFGGGEYMTAAELYGYVQLLQLVPNFDYVRAFKNIYLMQDEFDLNQEPSDMFKQFADDVLVFDTVYPYDNDLDEYLDELFGEFVGIDQNPQVPEILYSFIDWRAARDWLLNDYEKTEVNSKIYLWRKI
tara:strand:+ start:14999 stop:15598 length:600 start_codon:yes stop_codon:yes gene_type:complete